MTIQDLLRDLEYRLELRGNHAPVTNAEIGALARRGALDAAASDSGDAEELADTLENLREGGESSSAETDVVIRLSGGPTVVDTGADARSWAISKLLAMAAGADETLIDFRTAVLGGHLLDALAAEAWVQAQHAASNEARARWEIFRQEAGDPNFLRPPWRGLEWGISGISDHVRVIPAWPGTDLGRLRHVAEGLTRRYPWSAPQAAAFVLTGAVPGVAAIVGKSRTLLSGVRILLDVDPNVSAERLASFYRTRMHERDAGQRAPRIVDPKTAELAVFAVERGLLPNPLASNVPHGATLPLGEWMRGMNDWNRLHPEWAYGHGGTFGRQCRKAIERLDR